MKNELCKEIIGGYFYTNINKWTESLKRKSIVSLSKVI